MRNGTTLFIDCNYYDHRVGAPTAASVILTAVPDYLPEQHYGSRCLANFFFLGAPRFVPDRLARIVDLDRVGSHGHRE
jgi:hypothetical protein